MSFGSCPKAIARQMLQQHGIKSFFCALDGQFMRDGFFYTVFFGGYEVSKYTFRTLVPSMPDAMNFYIRQVLYGTLFLSCLLNPNSILLFRCTV